ncbi:MAG TPA: CCA tRNA nucleotidyltransferase [Acidimicrobiales bacterium]|nr:CCA tRNA nucleotidyltransferase [Acidimicrobiales bacterium]
MIPERIRPIVEETEELVRRFASAGKRIYLVGGTVRDAIAGRPGGGAAFGPDADVDFTTDARPDEIEALVAGWADAVWLQGKRFGTIGCLHGGRRYEITTHRAEAYDPSSRKPEVVFGDDIEGDLSRRDFTVNAMALRLPDLELVDPFDGLGDLAARRLRTPLDPEESFSDDPLRMLRAARFLAGYDLEPDPALVAAITTMRERISIVSAERIRDELDKLVVLPSPEAGLWFVVRSGLAGLFLPELPALALEQDPIQRHKDVLAHTIAVVAKTRPDRILRLAALFHDVGKPRTRAYGPDGVSFHHHDVVGARMARARMEALRYSAADTDQVARLVELHLRFHTYSMGWTDSALRRYARDAGDLLDRLNELTRADCTTRNQEKARALERRMDELEERLAELREREALDAIRPELDGDQVMMQLDIAPGPDVGRALAFLLDTRLEEGPLGEDEVRRRLDRWWEEQQGRR